MSYSYREGIKGDSISGLMRRSLNLQHDIRICNGQGDKRLRRKLQIVEDEIARREAYLGRKLGPQDW